MSSLGDKESAGRLDKSTIGVSKNVMSQSVGGECEQICCSEGTKSQTTTQATNLDGSWQGLLIIHTAQDSVTYFAE